MIDSWWRHNLQQAAERRRWSRAYGRSALNDSATCPCDYSLLHVAYRPTAFRPLINKPKSNIGFLVWQPMIVICPIIGKRMLKFTTRSADASCAQWLATPYRPVSNKRRWLQTYVWLTAESSQCQPLTAELHAPHHFCSVLHFRLLMGVYFLTVHGRSLSVPDRYWIADSEAADFTGSVRSNFGWIVRPLGITLKK